MPTFLSIGLAFVVGCSAATLGAECQRDLLVSEKDEKPVGTLNNVDYQSLVGKREGETDYTYIYCAKHTRGGSVKFQWFKSVAPHTYFDSFVGPEEIGYTDSESGPYQSADRRVLYNYTIEGRADTLFDADEKQRLTATAEQKVLRTAADILIPVSEEVFKLIAADNYKYDRQDFVQMRLVTSSRIEAKPEGFSVSNSFEVQGEDKEGQFLAYEMDATKETPIMLTGDLEAFGFEENLSVMQIAAKSFEKSFPIDKNAKLHAVPKRISVIGAGGRELASVSFNIFAEVSE